MNAKLLSLESGAHKPLVLGPNPSATSILADGFKLAQKKQHKLAPTKLPEDFTLKDILQAPARKKDIKPVIDGTGCLHCGSTRITAKGTVKVFRGQRMQPYHCFECGRDCYKNE